MRFKPTVELVLLLALVLTACSGGVLPETGDGGMDATTHHDDAATSHGDGATGGDGGSADAGSSDVDSGSGDVDAGGALDAGSGDVDAGSGEVDAGTDAGPIDAGYDAGGRDSGSGCVSGMHMDGCCYVDGDCDPGHVCYGASCSPFFSRAGACLAPPTDPMHCWDDTDCTGTMDRCMGARYCGCGGIFCGPDMMGTCGTGFPFP